jgi:hypothetical protein
MVLKSSPSFLIKYAIKCWKQHGANIREQYRSIQTHTCLPSTAAHVSSRMVAVLPHNTYSAPSNMLRDLLPPVFHVCDALLVQILGSYVITKKWSKTKITVSKQVIGSNLVTIHKAHKYCVQMRWRGLSLRCPGLQYFSRVASTILVWHPNIVCMMRFWSPCPKLDAMDWVNLLSRAWN